MHPPIPRLDAQRDRDAHTLRRAGYDPIDLYDLTVIAHRLAILRGGNGLAEAAQLGAAWDACDAEARTKSAQRAARTPGYNFRVAVTPNPIVPLTAAFRTLLARTRDPLVRGVLRVYLDHAWAAHPSHFAFYAKNFRRGAAWWATRDAATAAIYQDAALILERYTPPPPSFSVD